MPSASILIELDKDVPVYKSGDTVNGKIIVVNEKPLQIRSIDARYRGKAHNCWYDHGSKSTYEAKEYYFDNEEILWPPNKSESGEVLSPGSHEYPIKFVLPQGCPSSFEGCVGWVRYTIFVSINRINSMDIERKLAFTVIGDFDLNNDAEAKVVPELSVHEELGLFNGKPIDVFVHLPKAGYVPGETINVKANINNNTGKKIKSFKLVIAQKSRFKGKCLATKHYKKYKEVAIHKEAAKMPEIVQQEWEGKIIVPSIPASELPGCSIIFIKHRLKLYISCGHGFSKVAIKIPIRIGTIPLEGTFFGNADPPRYESCIFGPVSVKEDEKNLLDSAEYTPLYPWYSMK